MTPNFSYFYKERYADIASLNSCCNYDFFVSFYNESYRVTTIFENVHATKKVILFDEDCEYVKGHESFKISHDELADINAFFAHYALTENITICLDITGFPVPYILLILKIFQKHNILKFDVLYSEPDYYKEKSKTKFTDDFVGVKQVNGFKGTHSSDETNDYLIIASGYDYSSIIEVCKHKENVHKKFQLFGFPSLQPDMYQENILKIYSAKSILNFENINDPEVNLFAPANDPFITAEEVANFIDRNNEIKKITNIYLSPLSTKAQALGFGLYYLWNNCTTKPVSIIYPYCNKIFGNTSEGLSKISVFHIELPAS